MSVRMSNELSWIHLENWPIFEQLQLEEALLRTDTRNFCLVNFGSTPAVVMGISNKQEELLHQETFSIRPIPIIRRFSGGGTVVVNEKTLFVTFIFSKKSHSFPLFPEPIHRWVASLYQEAWDLPTFALKENDYVIGDKKCGGNAQYITKERWLHHTSFLWDYTEDQMRYLKLPPKRPNYRLDRTHADFLTRLSVHKETPLELLGALKETLSKQFVLTDFDVKGYCPPTHRKATSLVAPVVFPA